MTDQETTLLYALSTLAQTCAALAAFVGAVGVFRLQLLLTSRDQVEETIKGSMAQRISRERSVGEIVEKAYDLLANSPDQLTGVQRANLLTSLPKWKDFPLRYNRARWWLIGFEAWNLFVIALSLVGFNHIEWLASCRYTFWSFWPVAIVTVLLTGWCVSVWTRE